MSMENLWTVQALCDSEVEIHVVVTAANADDAKAAVMDKHVMGDGWPAVNTIISVVPLVVCEANPLVAVVSALNEGEWVEQKYRQ